MIQSIISNSAHSNSEEVVDVVRDSEELVDTVSYPKSNPLVAIHTSDRNCTTDTANGNYPHKLLAKRKIPAIIQGVIPPVHLATADWFLHIEGL